MLVITSPLFPVTVNTSQYFVREFNFGTWIDVDYRLR